MMKAAALALKTWLLDLSTVASVTRAQLRKQSEAPKAARVAEIWGGRDRGNLGHLAAPSGQLQADLTTRRERPCTQTSVQTPTRYNTDAVAAR